ncbi:hypothetical protein CAOG_05369 [Capsaspora owczarzaki ATCC 30864]|uniref:hypothetical protein n=1 Tax=Capsaspora owczarzaki (strain ATCC 30864) TaxID=595528 RepID=UPI0001FE5446|nr:hypothetical protein CAOG_05369 [Capsaspora owczarzaki ATCC 30864]|eukprot:XP_004347054.1 hypothetical protein CAOG_05369 [Capsaspora owczarzaki ATCC 30864]
MASSSNSAHPAAAAAGLSPSDSSAASEEDDFLKRFESFSLALRPAKPAPPPLDPADVMRKYDELAKAVANLSLKEVKTDVEGVVEKVKPLYTAVGVVNDYIDYALTMFPTLTPMSAQFCLDSIQRPVKTYRKEVEAKRRASKRTTGSPAPATAASAPAIRPNFVITTMNGQPLLVVEVKCPTTHRVKGMYVYKGGDLEPREVPDNNPDPDAVKHNTTLGHLQGQLYDYLRSFHKDLGMVPYFGILTTYHEWAVYWLADDMEQHLQDTPSCTTECATVSDVGEFKKIILELERRATATTDAQWPSLKDVPTFGDVYKPATTSAKVFQQGEATRRLIRTRVFKWNDPDLVNVLQNVIFKAYHLSQLRFHPHFGESSSCLLYSNNQLTQTRTHGRVQLDFNTFSNKVVRSGYIFGGPKPTNVYCFVDLGRGRDGHAWLASPYTKLNHGVCVLKDDHVRLCEDEERRPILVAAARAVEHMASLGYRHKDVRWRHVGIYRIMGDDTLYAVLIDLSDVEKVSDKAEARKGMLAKLDIDESLLE